MADIKKTIVEDHDGKIMTGKSPAMAEVDADVACRDERRDNVMYDRSRMKDEIHQKGEELPEPIRHKDESKGMAPCLPSINLSELATILRDPNMPSPKILNEVADKMMIRSEESESDDGSVSSGGIVGMKGLLDCIFEVSYRHEESASSDDDDDLFERFSREIPCSFCSKIFDSTMTWNTHVLVAHQHLDSSVLNIRRMSINDSDRKDSGRPTRKHSRGSSKPDYDVKETKVCHTATDKKQTTELTHSENTPVHKRRSSFSKGQQKETSAGKSCHKYQSTTCHTKKESLPEEREITGRVPACDMTEEAEDVHRTVNQNEMTDTYVAPIDFTTRASTSDVNLGEDTQTGRKRKATVTSPLPEFTLHEPTSSNPKHSKKYVARGAVSLPQHKQSDSSAGKIALKERISKSKRISKAATAKSTK